MVLYKRNKCDLWMGSGTVISKEYETGTHQTLGNLCVHPVCCCYLADMEIYNIIMAILYQLNKHVIFLV